MFPSLCCTNFWLFLLVNFLLPPPTLGRGVAFKVSGSRAAQAVTSQLARYTIYIYILYIELKSQLQNQRVAASTAAPIEFK